MWLKFKQLFFIAYLTNVYCAKFLALNTEDIKQKLINNKVSKDDLKGLHRVFVKRIVPHGTELKGLEYNEKFNFLYRPLTRVHVQKSSNDDRLADNKELYSERQRKDSEYYKNLVENYQRLNDRKNKRLKTYKKDNQQRDVLNKVLQLLLAKNYKNDDRKRYQSVYTQKSKRNPNDVKFLLKLLCADKNDDISKYSNFKKVSSDLLDAMYAEKSKSKKKFWDKVENKIETVNEKKDFYKNLIKTFSQVLRYGDDKKEPNVGDSNREQAAEAMTEKPKMPLPFYPYWNWWTYKKNLYHDNCRHGWVRYHNVCYELPPH